MRLVEVVTDAGLRGYGAAKAQVAIASNHHALVTPITAELAASATARFLPGWSW